MHTVVVTDAKYRSAIAAVRTLGRGGFRVIAAQSRVDSPTMPPAFASRYVSAFHWLPDSAETSGNQNSGAGVENSGMRNSGAGMENSGMGNGGYAETDDAYAESLLHLLERYDHPVLLCAGAKTLNAVSWRRARFREACDFLISPPAVLDSLNDKAVVQRRCEELGIPVPRRYSGRPDHFPVIIKPRCGEKFALKAKDRYRIAQNESEWEAALSAVTAWDPEPVVQEKIDGDGAGVSLLLGRGGELLGALCHRRIREYPISGGPSACCESFYDENLIAQAHRLLCSFGFEGLAMVEYKGGRVLEVNPRIWGSFPLTEICGSPLAIRYAQAAAGEAVSYTPCDYQTGVRMRFLLNDTAALWSLFRHGQFRAFFSGVPDCFRAAEALSDRDDPAPMRRYLRNTLWRK